jgi:hypothetical protein
MGVDPVIVQLLPDSFIGTAAVPGAWGTFFLTRTPTMTDKDADFGFLIGGPVVGQLLPFDESVGVFKVFAPECTLTLFQWDQDEYECACMLMWFCFFHVARTCDEITVWLCDLFQFHL